MFGAVGGACIMLDVLCIVQGLLSKESLINTVPSWVQVVQFGVFFAYSLVLKAKEFLFMVRSSLMYTEVPFSLILRPYTSYRSLILWKATLILCQVFHSFMSSFMEYFKSDS